MPGISKKTKMSCVRMPVGYRLALIKLDEKTGYGMAHWIKEAVREYLERRNIPIPAGPK